MKKCKAFTPIKSGFTLIELLIVVSIISLLILTGFFLAKNQYLKGRDARRKSDIHKIQEAVEEYEKDHDCYPSEDLVRNCDPGVGLKPYMAKIPCDPATGSYYYYENDNPSGCGKWYRIFISLDNLNDKDIIPAIGPDSKYNFYLASPNAPVPVTSYCAGINYYGCIGGVCQLIGCKAGGLPICQPGYDNPNCNGQCGTPSDPQNPCTP